MNTKKNLRSSSIIAAVCLLVIIVLIKVATFFPDWIENNFSRGFYPGIARLYRKLFGGLPFSLGDILYLIAAFFCFCLLFKFVMVVIKRRIRLLNYKQGLLKAFSVAIIYILFNISWGLNYNRLGIAYQLKLEPEEYTVTDLKNITGLLLVKVNQDRLALGDGKIHYPLTKQIFWKANNAYQNASFNYPSFNIKHAQLSSRCMGDWEV